MAYAPFLKLGAMETLPLGRRLLVLDALLHALAVCDYQYLLENPGTPAIYEALPQYVIKSRPWVLGAQLDEWKDIPEILATESGDCKDFSCWRCAELWKKGHWDVHPCVKAWSPRPGDIIYHIMVKQGRAVEDPSKILGMPMVLTADEMNRVLNG